MAVASERLLQHTPAAQKLLARLAQGEPLARVTKEAASSLQRLK